MAQRKHPAAIMAAQTKRLLVSLPTIGVAARPHGRFGIAMTFGGITRKCSTPAEVDRELELLLPSVTAAAEMEAAPS